MKKFWSFKFPNPLICDNALSYSARRVGAVLYSHRNHFGLCHKSRSLLTKYAHCSADTVRKAPEDWERAGGYITCCRNHKYSVKLGRVVYDRNTYCAISRSVASSRWYPATSWTGISRPALSLPARSCASRLVTGFVPFLPCGK